MTKDEAKKRLGELVKEYSSKGNTLEEVRQVSKDMIMFTVIAECLDLVLPSEWDNIYQITRAVVE